MGDNCELQYDVCGLVPCKNNGTCVSSRNRRDYHCRCLLGRVIRNAAFPLNSVLIGKQFPVFKIIVNRSADKTLAQPGRKQATVTEDLDVHTSNSLS